MIDFGQLFGRAWELCWRQRWLFLLGILAVLGTSRSSPQFGYSFSGEVGPDFERQVEQFLEGLVANWPWLVALGVGLLLVNLLLWLLRLTAQGSLIAAADELDAGEPATLRSSWRRGLRRLPTLVGLDLLLFGPLFLLILVPILIIALTIGSAILVVLQNPALEGPPLGMGEGFILAIACLCIMGCLAIFWRVFLAFLHPLAQRSAVLEPRGVFGAVRRGWGLLREYPGDVLLLVLFFFVIGIVFGALLSALMVPLGLVLAVPTIFDMMQGGAPEPGRLVALVVGSMILGFLGQILLGFFAAYKSVAYTLAYRQLTGKVERVEKVPAIPDDPYTFSQE